MGPALRGEVHGSRGFREDLHMTGIITGRAPPSHGPAYENPRRVRRSHGLDKHPG